MGLHARNLATVAGASGDLLEKVVAQMIADKKVQLEYAQELVAKFKK
jgi:hydroxymethylglutaryl-CoA reductase